MKCASISGVFLKWIAMVKFYKSINNTKTMYLKYFICDEIIENGDINRKHMNYFTFFIKTF